MACLSNQALRPAPTHLWLVQHPSAPARSPLLGLQDGSHTHTAAAFLFFQPPNLPHISRKDTVNTFYPGQN